MNKSVPLKDLKTYQLAHQLGEDVWRLVSSWGIFEKRTLVEQLIRSSDSISFNISEAHGRFFYRDKRNFYYYSRGSLYEAAEGLKKAHNRDLISESEYTRIKENILQLTIKLNNLIGAINRKLNQKTDPSNDVQ
jgi:four helix bundle protein